MRNGFYFLSGLIFAFGLLLSGMADSEKIINFLSLGSEEWDVSLFFVLCSAVIVYFLVFYFLRIRGRTILGTRFENPPPRPLDKKLFLGAAIFGLGWGLVGLCPGPALVNVSSLSPSVIVFVLTMFLGFEFQKRISV